MKVLIYVNKDKDLDNSWENNLTSLLDLYNIEYQSITSRDLDSTFF